MDFPQQMILLRNIDNRPIIWTVYTPMKNCLFTGGYLKEFTDEESNFTAILQRAMDLEGVDKETVYQLVSLLMKVCCPLCFC